jgi:hypothetical protein
LGIWKVRAIRRGAKKGRHPLLHEGENEIHVFPDCKEMQRWRKQFLNEKWLHINDKTAHNKIISCSKIPEFKKLGKLLYKFKKVRKPSQKYSARS